MPERVPSNHEFLPSLRDWSGTSTMKKESGNETNLCSSNSAATGPSTRSSTGRTSPDSGLILADAQVPVVTVRGGR